MSKHHRTAQRGRAMIGSAIVVVVVAIVSVVVAVRLNHTNGSDVANPAVTSSSTSRPSATLTPTTSTVKPTPRPTPRRPTVEPKARVDAVVAKIASQLPAGGVSVAAVNTKTGASYRYGAAGGMRLGSVYKLLVLETLLLQHQDAGTPMTGYEMSQATPMIANSDNDDAFRLYIDIGSKQGLAAGAARLGLKHTVPGSDPALTTSSASDIITLARNLVVTNGPLNASSRSVALGLLRQVESDQKWGVGAAADRGSLVINKNGWLSVDNTNGPGENDNGLWLATSVGVVTVHGQQVLMSVLTQHNESFEDGVEACNALAKAIAPAVIAR